MNKLIYFFENADPIKFVAGAFGLLIVIGILLILLATLIRTIYEILTGK